MCLLLGCVCLLARQLVVASYPFRLCNMQPQLATTESKRRAWPHPPPFPAGQKEENLRTTPPAEGGTASKQDKTCAARAGIEAWSQATAAYGSGSKRHLHTARHARPCWAGLLAHWRCQPLATHTVPPAGRRTQLVARPQGSIAHAMECPGIPHTPARQPCCCQGPAAAGDQAPCGRQHEPFMRLELRQPGDGLAQWKVQKAGMRHGKAVAASCSPAGPGRRGTQLGRHPPKAARRHAQRQAAAAPVNQGMAKSETG